jgi:hypothetical protein
MPSNLGSSPTISTPLAKKQKTSYSPGSAIASSPLLSQNKQAKILAEQRDDSRCVLTKDGAIDVAYIYPFHSIKHKEEDMFRQRHVFWDFLKNFWPEEKVTA